MQMEKDFNYMGNVIEGRFKVGTFINSGSNGIVYNVIDMTDFGKSLVIKISPTLDQFDEEVAVMKQVYE